MRKPVKYVLLLLFLAGCFGLFTTTFGVAQTGATSVNANATTQQAAKDTTNRFPVKKTQITNYQDIAEKKPIDLRDPSNVKTEIVYDYPTNTYLYKTKIGDQEWITPFSMTADEYNSLSLKQGMSTYFKQKNDELFETGSTKDQFALKDVSVPLGAAERIFGPGGVKIRPQGYVELSMGVKRNTNNIPTLSESRRTTTLFDVDEKINLSVDASIGDKMNFNLNYNTEATFDFDSKRMKLAYEGKEDEIIKYLEAGNVSLNTTNSLIGGSTSLFGIRADLQFGKLRVNTVVSQQQSESTTAKSSGGIQSRSFEFKASDYEENRHFFLAEYFRDNYDEAMSKLPYITSKIRIDKLEVWVTNKRGNFNEARDIVAFADLAEYNNINNIAKWTPQSTSAGDMPSNQSNNLYSTVTTNSLYAGTRNNNKVIEVLTGQGLELGQDFEKVESARLLSASEYTFDAQLGYLSVDGYSLQQDEVLAVAFNYTINGVTYQVGDFASQITNLYDDSNKKSGSLILKLLKPTSLSPISYTWNLMMKNIYRMGAYNIQSDRFRLNIGYQNDTIGTYMDYLTEGNIKDIQLIKVMNLDRLNARHNVVKTSLDDGRIVYGDGIFDFVEGYTVRASKGTIIFPVVEPFGKHLTKQIGNPAIAEKYAYQQLYDSTLTIAKQAAEFDKFKIYGSYRASNSNEIDLGVTNVVRGSVRVTAGGVLLNEGTDYTVDYMSGTVTITNTQYSNSQISATVENQTLFNMQTRTLLGTNVSYEFNKDFSIGTTVLHMYEKPINTKMGIGSESVNNTLVGFNTSWRKQSQWLTNLIDKIPFVEATAPSQIQFEGEFAKMFADHYKGQGGGYSYLDDFETSRSRISLRDPYGWSLSSTPEPLLNSKAYGDIKNGNRRALLAWYYIDNMFTRKNSSLRPGYITNDDLSNHYVREVTIREIYPFREQIYNETSALSVMNLSYYPRQRGPYNLDADKIDTDGSLLEPEKRWGGMSRKIDTQNFEAANVQYIEFWLLDPFIYNDTLPATSKNKGGNLYFNLGDISEDVLRDGLKFYENGLGMPGDTTLYTTTVWGHVPKRQSTVYAFDFSDGKDALLYAQDVGFNGLSTEQEFEFPTYKKYLDDYRGKLTAQGALERAENDPFSPLRDPAGDNFHYFRGSDYDRDQVSILDRYKYINGTERNTVGSTTEGYTTSMKRTPDVEDINQDYTMNEAERYYQYKVAITPDSLNDLSNSRITDRREVEVDLPNGNKEKVTWYQFKIPINQPDSVVGKMNSLTSIRFIRMYLQNFTQTTHLRFATLDLVKGDWRIYTKNLLEVGPQGRGNLEITSVNLEENGTRKPVNYVVPPGVSRILDPGQPQLRQDNEQALSMRITDLESEKARAIYKNTSYDLRRYKRIEMFTHAENFEDQTELKKGDFSIFMRLGTDYQNNYYEYEIPLEVTPADNYSTYNLADRLAVWPKNNMFDFPLELLKNVKLKRNKEKRKAGSNITYATVYYEHDPDKPNNKVSVKGNPSLSEVNVIMIGIRNNTRFDRSGEVWINELRLTDFDEEGGWAAKGNLSVALSDVGMVQLSGHKETVGFGSIDQSLMERRADDFQTYSISTSVDAGRFLPKQAKLSLPIYYTYSNETNTPKYDPLDQDVTLTESLSLVNTKHEKDSIKNLAQTKQVSRSFNITGAKLNIRSKTPMPYDPANFTVNYSHVQTTYNDPTTSYDIQLNTETGVNYTYSPMQKTWAPFKDSKSKSPFMKFPKALGFNYVPNSITVNSNLRRIYYETVTRDLESYTLGANNTKAEMLTFSGEYYWDRDFALNWDFTKNLKFSIQTGTKAEIEEPFLQVNKKLNPDDYDKWKESVNNSIKKFGNPYEYHQTTALTYNIPLSTIPILDWVNSSATYNSTYDWVKGAVADSVEIGNTIRNSMTLSINGRFNMVNLYNKWSFLKKVNQKFTQSSSSTSSRTPAASRAPRKVTPRKVEKTVMLSKDSTVTVTHNLKSKNIEILAKSADNNRTYKVKFKKIDDNTIKITTKDSIKLNLSIREKPEGEESAWYKVAQYTARGLMSVRNVNILYSKRKESYIYGFTPGIGDFFGQSSSMVPGIGFALGLEGDEDFLQKAKNKEWLLLSDVNNTPASFNKAEKLNIDLQVEPFRGLKIDLKAFREKNDQVNVAMTSQTNSLRTLGGSFSMTISTLSTAFESSNLKNNYESASFNKFLDNREKLQNRLQANYKGNYPNEGFIAGMNMGNKPYDADNGTVQNSSSDVLIPAFLAAYTGKDANKVGTSPFLALTSMVPNWSVTYDGLTTLPWFKDKFKNFKLMHNYSSVYRIGNYSSFPEWVSLGGSDFGFIGSAQDAGMIIPSSPYNIMAVSIIESFRPLFGAEGTLKNNMTLGLRYNKERSLNLNVSSYQVVETAAKELVITMGYRINEFNRIIGITSRSTTGFNNDLNIKADISYKTNQALLRKIEDRYTQATAGVDITTLKVSADYAVSKMLMLRAYFDKVINTPLISASANPNSVTNIGISIRFTLTQ